MSENKFSLRPGDIEILNHPEPDVLKKAKEYQEKAKQERKAKEKKDD